MKYRVVELFSGVGAQRMALKRVAAKHPEIEFEFLAQCDIDKWAIQSYNAIHGETPNLGDISKVERIPDCDILTYSFPCTDLSMAGAKQGMEKGSGTRSALVWEVLRVLKNSHKPEWLIMENVPAITFKTNIDSFEEIISILSDMGYTSRYEILNATDFNVAQNRKRCFMVSHYHGPVPKFPTGPGLHKCLRDYLEKDVDAKFYLSKERMEGLMVSCEKQRELGNGFGNFTFSDGDDPAKAITTNADRKTGNYVNMDREERAK